MVVKNKHALNSKQFHGGQGAIYGGSRGAQNDSVDGTSHTSTTQLGWCLNGGDLYRKPSCKQILSNLEVGLSIPRSLEDVAG